MNVWSSMVAKFRDHSTPSGRHESKTERAERKTERAARQRQGSAQLQERRAAEAKVHFQD